MTNVEFIEQMAICAQTAYRVLGKVKPSVAIAMACVESAYGRAGSAKYNSYFGHKVGSGKTATKYWPGKFFTSKTKEEYTVGTHTIIQAAFRSYDSMQQCCFNFYELLNTSLYKKVLSTSSAEQQIEQIKACGYMTSSTEVNTVKQIISKYDLKKYDDIVDYSGAVESTNVYHTVVKGDTLIKISIKYYGVSSKWVQIQRANNISGTIIYPGQKLLIPKGV